MKLRGYTSFKERQFDLAMAGVNPLSHIMMAMVMLSVVVILTLLELELLLATPSRRWAMETKHRWKPSSKSSPRNTPHPTHRGISPRFGCTSTQSCVQGASNRPDA